MSHLILTAHTGIHDAGAALFEDYNLLAAVQLERMTRFKCDGRDHPDLAIDEVLSIAGKTRQDVDVAVSAAANFQPYFTETSAACAGYGKNIANI
jgi:carbamoyltransferase